MNNISINNRFRSILYVLIHFSCSLIQLACALAILGLQITLTVTQTCAFRIGVGFWSFPFLLVAPMSIWFLLWKRNSVYCILTFIAQICSTLFATTVIIISFLVLIGSIALPCSTSSITTNYFLSLNICLIAVSVCLKIFIYGEIFLLYLLQRNTNEPSILLEQEFQDKNYQIISDRTSMTPRSPFRSIIKKSEKTISDFNA